MHSPPQGVLPLDSCWVEQTSICPAAGNLVTIAGRSERRDLVMYMPRHEQIFGVMGALGPSAHALPVTVGHSGLAAGVSGRPAGKRVADGSRSSVAGGRVPM